MCDETRKRDDRSLMYACFNGFTSYPLQAAQASVKVDFNKLKGTKFRHPLKRD